MTTYYVDGNSGNDSNNGSSERPWRTLNKAKNSINAGDEVRIRTATYYEALTINRPNTTWRADSGHKPVIDGRYNDSLMSNGRMPLPGPSHLPGGEYGNMILVDSSGVVIDGLTIQNCAGSGIGMASVADVTIRNCRIDFTRDNNINITGGAGYADRIIVENNVLTRGSVRWLVPQLPNWGAAVGVGKGRDVIVRNNLIAYIYGEGIDPHRGTLRTIVEGNVVHTCLSTHIYIQRARDNIIRRNFVFHLATPPFIRPNGTVAEGIMIGDETESVAFPHSAGDQIYNNVVVGCGILFNVANGGPTLNTQLNKTYIGYNTFVGGPRTFIGIFLTDNLFGRPFVNSLFENNIICNVPINRPICQAEGALSGLTFRNNVWDRQPSPQARGNGDRIGNPMLVNSAAVLENTFPDPTSRMEPRNYQLTSTSNLAIGMASNGGAVNGIQPPTIQKDFFGGNRDAQPDIGAHEYAGVTIILTANFSIGPGQATGSLPHTVDFIDKSTSTHPIVSHQWDFGDGETSTETNPSHTYAKAGSFDVSLTITDSEGGTSTSKQEGLITVNEVPSTVLPNTFRRFALVSDEGKDVVAYGTQYPDLRCVLLWNEDPFHILNFDTIADVEKATLDSGITEIVWIDPGDQEGTLSMYSAPVKVII